MTVLLQRGAAQQGEPILAFNRVLLLDGEQHQGFDYGSASSYPTRWHDAAMNPPYHPR